MQKRKQCNKFMAWTLACLLIVTSLISSHPAAYAEEADGLTVEMGVSVNDMPDENRNTPREGEAGGAVENGTGEEENVYSAYILQSHWEWVDIIHGIMPGEPKGGGGNTFSELLENVKSAIGELEEGSESDGVYLAVCVNRTPSEPEDIAIPEGYHVAVIAEEERLFALNTLQIPDGGEVCITGRVEGDLPVVYSADDALIILHNATVDGNIYAAEAGGSPADVPAGTVEISDNVCIGGIYNISTVNMARDLYVKDLEGSRIEFNGVENFGYGHQLYIEGYREERIPAFLGNVGKAYEYKMLLESTEEYAAVWYDDSCFVKIGDEFYEAEPTDCDRVVVVVKTTTAVEDESLKDELEGQIAGAEKKYVCDNWDEYPVYRYWNEDGEESCYIEKDGELYRCLDRDEYPEGDKCIADSSVTRIKGQAVSENSIGDANGGLSEIPAVAVRYITQETFRESMEDVPLPYGTKVVSYPKVQAWMPYRITYWQERWDDGYDADNAFVDLDGVVYDQREAPAEVKRLVSYDCLDEEGVSHTGTAEDSFAHYGRDWYNEEYVGTYANVENAMLAMKLDAAEGNDAYYCLWLKENYSEGSIEIDESIKGVCVDAAWIMEGQEDHPNRIVLSNITGAEDTALKLCWLYLGGEEEDADADSLTIDGIGTVTLLDCKINQTVNAGNAAVSLLGENTVKSLSGAGELIFEDGVLGVEDFLDASDSTLKGSARIAARSDAGVILGAVDTLTGEEIEDECPLGYGVDLFAETEKGGEGTDITLTSGDLSVGYGLETYWDEETETEGIRYFKEDEEGYKEYILFENDRKSGWFIETENGLESLSETPENVSAKLYRQSVNVRMLDKAADSLFSTKSLYAQDSCFYDEDESKDFDHSCNFVEYDAGDSQRILSVSLDLSERLEEDEDEKADFFKKVSAVYRTGNQDALNEMWLDCMGAYERETKEPESERFYGKPVFTENDNGKHYLMCSFDWECEEEADRVVVDANKYILAKKRTDISGAVVSEIPDQIYTGNVLTPAVTVTLNGTVLERDADYGISYRNNVNVGTATVVITGIGNYQGEKTVSFTIVERETEKPHVHTAGEWTVQTDATGTETGLKVKKCTVCGEVLDTQVIPKYVVELNAAKAPLQVKKSTTAIKAAVMEGDRIAGWESSDTKVATVNSSGKITGKKAGKAIITVTTVKGAKAGVWITVQKKPVKTTKLKADKKSITLTPKQSYQLDVVKTPVTSPDKITYSTSDKKIATVNKSGKITAKKAGKATITIKCGSKKITVKVSVSKGRI